MKTLYLSVLLFASLFVHASEGQPKDRLKVFELDGNIYLAGGDGKKVQLTTSGKDDHPILSPNGQQVIFVRQVQALKDNPWGMPEDDAEMMYAAWSPDEIWTMDIKDKQPKVLCKSTYEGRDAKNHTGWFRGLKFSPDGKTIYYVCQPCCPTTWAVHAMRSDGTGDRWVSWGEKVDVVGGDKSDKCYGYLVVERKADDGAYDITVLLAPDGKKIAKISPEEFWKTHEKVGER